MKKKKIIILVLFIICLIILMLVGFKYYEYKKELEQTAKPLTEVKDPKEDDVLNLSGFGVFFEQYTGELKSSEIAKHLEDVTITYLPQLFSDVKELDEPGLNTYYLGNSEQIKENLGIEDYEKFTAFIEKLKGKGEDLELWYRLDIIKDTFKNKSDKDDYAYVEYTVSLKNDETIKFSLYVIRKSSIIPNYIIDIIN